MENSLQIIDLPNYSPGIKQACNNLYYRQSMIQDYLICPNMFLYRWLIGHEESDTFFAAVAGTAGHKVIETFHKTRKFDYSYVDIVNLFQTYLAATISSERIPPKLGVKFQSLTDQCEAVSPQYCEMLSQYQKDEQNRNFHVTMCEQLFALQLRDEFNRDFIFTGTLDQAGHYEDGTFALRDIKFRLNNFRPKGKVEVQLNIQLSLYAYALQHGNPACDNCKPCYSPDGTLVYAGPCRDCESKIGTSAWPKLACGRVEIIWMRDYETRKKNEFQQYTVSDTEKERNPLTGRLNKAKVINPKFVDGYKIGDQVGDGHIVSERTQAFLKVHVADILRIAGMIRDGRFYRKSGDHCNYWCKHKEPCLNSLEMEVGEIDVMQLNENLMTTDPFGD